MDDKKELVIRIAARTVKIIPFALLLLAVSAGRARADSWTAISFFTGTITQAPSGNGFGITVGEQINGMVLYPTGPVVPNNPIFIDTNVEVGLTIGPITYTPVLASGDESVTLSTETGFVTGIEWVYPQHPIRPSLTLSGNQFFTTDCAPGAVCGTLDFSSSQVTATPEPPTTLLVACGILALAFWAKTGQSATRTAESQTGTTGSIASGSDSHQESIVVGAFRCPRC